MSFATSADLLEMFDEMAGRAPTDTITPAQKYKKLARAEKSVLTELVRVARTSFYPKGVLPQLETTDHNIFTFGTDTDDLPIVPYGDCQIFSRLTDVPDRPWRRDWDYLDEGTQIRLPRGRKFTGPLYYRGVVSPADISETENPHFIPVEANELTVIRAVRDFAATGNLRAPAVVAEMRIRWNERYPVICSLLKRQFSDGGALRTYSARDLVTPLL
jgi:hypothetical protein